VTESGTPLYDVAIVGFGPTGAVLANLLGIAGLSVVVLERERAIYPLPRAIHFDGEVMRILHDLGLGEALRRVLRPGLHGMQFINAQGETMLVRRASDQPGLHGFLEHYYFHQPELEQVLRDGVRRFPSVDVRLGHEVVELAANDERVRLSVQDVLADESGGVIRLLDARYVVGCDGARSMVRADMGSRLTDLGLRQPWLVFDILLNGEDRLPPNTVQICDPARPMTYCNVVGQRRRWEIMVLPDDDPADLLVPERLWQLVQRWITPAEANLERAVIYTFHSLIVEGWRKGRMILAGDACHQTPPFLGQGLCAGIRDAANLSWKLSAVLRNLAEDHLLDSYEAERAPHARKLIELAVHLGGIIQTTDPVLAAARDARFRANNVEVIDTPQQVIEALECTIHDRDWVGHAFPAFPGIDWQPLDELVGREWAIVGKPSLMSSVPDSLANRWRSVGARIVDQPHPDVMGWLDDAHAQAVLLRPDHYVAGLARSLDDLQRISKNLPCPLNS